MMRAVFCSPQPTASGNKVEIKTPAAAAPAEAPAAAPAAAVAPAAAAAPVAKMSTDTAAQEVRCVRCGRFFVVRLRMLIFSCQLGPRSFNPL